LNEQGQKYRMKVAEPYTIRKLAKSGNSRYLSIGRVVPSDWVAVKVFVVGLKDGVCTLRLEQIK